MKIIIVEFLNAIIILCLCRLFRLGIVCYRKKVKKQLSYYKLLINWNLCDARNEKLCSYMMKTGYRRVMIYGAGDLGKIFYYKIKEKIKVYAFVEKLPKRDYIGDVPILSCEEAKQQMGETDCIIVTPVFDFEKIQRELSGGDYNVPIIPLDMLIYNL